MTSVIIIHYHEIALKGRNRSFFEDRLSENIKKSLSDESVDGIPRLFGRIIVFLSEDSDVESITEKLKKIFGIAYFASGYESSRDFEKLKEDIWSAISKIVIARDEAISKEQFVSFRITAKRSDKSYLLDSREIDKQIGSHIWRKLEESGKIPKVDLENPDINVVIEITGQGIFFYFSGCHCEEHMSLEERMSLRGVATTKQSHNIEGKIRGLSGLPTSTSGKVVSLISGGFDSPVASWKMMRRGVEVIFVHFHSYPSTSLASKENVRELIKILTQYQFHSRAYFIPFLDIQKSIMLNCDPSYGVILYRRFMMRLAQKIAEKEGAKALVTGDSLGQVASQTLENIVAVSGAVDLPIFRPLIGENKEDIIELAQKIGTFEISSQPQDDCCSLFVPKHPKTKARIEDVLEMEKKLDIAELIKNALERTEIEIFDI